MVAGIIVSAAADQKVLSDPSVTASTASAWMILGGPALFLAGHAAFKLVVWRYPSWPRWPGSPCSRCSAWRRRRSRSSGSPPAAGVVAAVAATDRLPGIHPPR